MVNWLLIVRDTQGAAGQEGGGVFAAVFVDQHVVVRERGFNIGFHWRTRTVDSGGEDQDQCGQAGGRPAARYADRHVRAGGVGQPETRRHSNQRKPHACPRHRASGRR